jgi:hypothetical protein
MLKKCSWVLMVISTMLFAMGCGDDDDNNTSTKKDSGVNKDGQTTVDGTGTLPDTNGTIPDSSEILDSTTTPDTLGDALKPQTCTPIAQATANSGKLCDPTKETSECATGEECAIFSEDATVGMCLGVCCPDKNNYDDDSWVCPGTDTAKSITSLCLLSNSAGTAYSCGYICYSKSSDGTETNYELPDTLDKTKYECKGLSATSTTKFWIPIQS